MKLLADELALTSGIEAAAQKVPETYEKAEGGAAFSQTELLAENMIPLFSPPTKPACKHSLKPYLSLHRAWLTLVATFW